MILKNDTLQIEVRERGAEMVSLRSGEEEMLWCGDAAYWGRHAPILFPIVGKVWNGEYRVDGRVYCLPQHGFARDTDFVVTAGEADEIRMVMPEGGHEEVYPYRFGLDVCYRLEDATVVIDWCVENRGEADMYFQIGAHPAFYYKDFDAEEAVHGTVAFGGRKIPLTAHTFDNDALIFEDGGIREMTLLDTHLRPYLRVECQQAQVWGVWSPTGKNAPFVCLEPWCGRKDNDGFAGDISERDYIQKLEPQGRYHFVYRITVL